MKFTIIMLSHTYCIILIFIRIIFIESWISGLDRIMADNRIPVDVEKLIIKYFRSGFENVDICSILRKNHNIKMKVRTLARRLKELGLRRRNIVESKRELIVYAIIKELHSSGFNLGYRSMWYRLILKYNLTVKRETVYKIMKIADPDGMSKRFGNKLKRRTYHTCGPNRQWHLDGYDKLAQFGIFIHACMDGWSTFIIWAEASSTNKDPRVIAYYYLNTVKKFNLVPVSIRSDKGSENTLIDVLQMGLRSKHDDPLSGTKSFIKGKSTANQRIESWWGQMRKQNADFYIQLFKEMRQKQLFNDSKLHVKCLQYSFGPLIKKDLEIMKNQWNSHYIRKQNGRSTVYGKPNVLYNLPEKMNSKDYKQSVNEADVNKLIKKFTTQPKLVDDKFKELVSLLIPNVSVPETPKEALDLYKEILKLIEQRKNQLRNNNV